MNYNYQISRILNEMQLPVKALNSGLKEFKLYVDKYPPYSDDILIYTTFMALLSLRKNEQKVRYLLSLKEFSPEIINNILSYFEISSDKYLLFLNIIKK